eukprot:scaffold5824_cov81-Skeletonema_marinoi.AAC.1
MAKTHGWVAPRLNEAGGEEEEESDDEVGFDDEDDLSEGEEQVRFGMGVDGTRAQAGFSGSFDDDDDISIPHEQAATSPSGSPVERLLLRARLNLLSRWVSTS